MPMERDRTPLPREERRQQLRQLEHNMKTYLGIVTMGVQALASVREDPAEFAEVSRLIEEDGVQPLKQIIAEIIAIAVAEENG